VFRAGLSNPPSTGRPFSTDSSWALRLPARRGSVGRVDANPVVGVLGGSGGVGASSFAAALAAAAGPSLLADLDVAGGGLDVLLGIETAPGARWSGLRVAGGSLAPATLLGGLPRWGPVAVLAADVGALEAAAVLQVLEVAASAVPVVVDLPRAACAERAAALLHCDLVLVVARADVSGVVAAHATVDALPDVTAGLVVRRGEVPAAEVAALVGRPLLGELPALGASRASLTAGRPPRAVLRVATGILRGLERRVRVPS
jgi:MinD superfamily P-loop ATPase